MLIAIGASQFCSLFENDPSVPFMRQNNCFKIIINWAKVQSFLDIHCTKDTYILLGNISNSFYKRRVGKHNPKPPMIQDDDNIATAIHLLEHYLKTRFRNFFNLTEKEIEGRLIITPPFPRLYTQCCEKHTNTLQIYEYYRLLKTKIFERVKTNEVTRLVEPGHFFAYLIEDFGHTFFFKREKKLTRKILRTHFIQKQILSVIMCEDLVHIKPLYEKFLKRYLREIKKPDFQPYLKLEKYYAEF